MINTQALEHCFDHTTQSYKFYWLMAILECVANQRYHINILDLSVRMASMAWYPILKHSVGFGKADSFRPKLSYLQEQVGIPVETTYFDLLPRLSRSMSQDATSSIVRPVLRQFITDVPYCFLSPWCTHKNSGEFIKGEFRRRGEVYIQGAPYSIKRDVGGEIYIHVNTDWVNYINSEYWKLNEMAMSGLRAFVTRRNKDLCLPQFMLEWRQDPAVVRQQVEYWNVAISSAMASGNPLRCLFSHQDLKVDAYRLDHYLPFGDAVSDRVWSIFPANLSAQVSLDGYRDYCSLSQFAELAHGQQLALRAYLMAGGSEGLANVEFDAWKTPVSELIRMSPESFARAYEACLSGASFQHSTRSFLNPLSSACAADDFARDFHLGNGATYIEHQYNK